MFTIRHLVPSDIPDLIDLVTVSFAEEYLAQGVTAVSLARQIRLVTWGRLIPFRLLTRLAGIHWEMWVAEVDGRAIGCGGFMGQQQMELGNLMVHPDWRRQGIGQALLLKRLERLQALDYPLATTTVLAHNTASLGNLQKQGFALFDRYHILERQLPLPPTPPIPVAWRRLHSADRTLFQTLEHDSVNPERLSLQGSASHAYFPTVGSRLLNASTGNRQQAAVFFKDDHPIGFSLVRTGMNQSKGVLMRPILPHRQHTWYSAMLQQAASWLVKQGKEHIQIALSTDQDSLVAELLANGWIQTQSWLRLVKYFDPKKARRLSAGQD